VLVKSPPKDCQTSRRILEGIEKREEASTSMSVLQEVVDWLEYNNRKKEVSLFLAAVNSYATMRKISNTWNDFLRASPLAEKQGIDFVDALTVQLMKRHKIREIYSNDRDFDRVEGITRVFQ
jgi:predicted nucleic acid-binding protein